MADINVDTYKLNQYAQRLAKVNSQLSNLDYRLSSLYYRSGLLGLYYMVVSDAMGSERWRLSQCQTYLEQTATDFEATEKRILAEDPITFTGVPTTGPVIIPGVTPPDGEQAEDASRSWFEKFMGNDLKMEGAWKTAELKGEGKWGDVDMAGNLTGSFLYGEAGFKNEGSAGVNYEDGKLSIDSLEFTTSAYATGALAKGEAEGNIGIFSGSATGQCVTGEVKGEIKFSVVEDGKFQPTASVSVGASGSVLQGEAELELGGDNLGVHVKGDGDVLHAEAEAKAGVGYLGKNKEGKNVYGASAEANAMASIAQGTAQGGFSIFGVDIDVGVTGYAGAVGVQAGGSVTTEGVKAKLGGALALGGGLEISVDWSDAQWVEDGAGLIVDAVDAVGDFLFGS